MSEQTGSQTADTQAPEDKNTAISEAFEAFGIPTPQDSEKREQEPDTSLENPPAKEDEESQPQKLKVKFNKQEIEVDEEKIPELVQKGLALEKERERKTEYQKALDRAARLQGFKDHEEFLANLDKIEADAKKREEDQFKKLRDELRQQAEDAGLDPDKVEEFINNHPLMLEARQIKADNERRAKEEQKLRQQEEINRQWAELYQAYPEIVDDAQAFTRGETPSFYTDEMKELVERGYHPLHAYQLAHMDKVKEKVRQAEIKKQIYNKRSQVETETHEDLEPEVPEALASAFSLFGLDPKRAKKYVQK